MVGPMKVSSVSSGNQQPARAAAEATTITGRRKLKRMLAAKVIEQNILRFDAQVGEHLDDRGVHHGRAAHVELAILGSRVALEVVLEQHVVDEAGRAVPVV